MTTDYEIERGWIHPRRRLERRKHHEPHEINKNVIADGVFEIASEEQQDKRDTIQNRDEDETADICNRLRNVCHHVDENGEDTRHSDGVPGTITTHRGKQSNEQRHKKESCPGFLCEPGLNCEEGKPPVLCRVRDLAMPAPSARAIFNRAGGTARTAP